ncbi:221_t:CDS:2, partial [Scutellospora calospora]
LNSRSFLVSLEIIEGLLGRESSAILDDFRNIEVVELSEVAI